MGEQRAIDSFYILEQSSEMGGNVGRLSRLYGSSGKSLWHGTGLCFTSPMVGQWFIAVLMGSWFERVIGYTGIETWFRSSWEVVAGNTV